MSKDFDNFDRATRRVWLQKPDKELGEDLYLLGKGVLSENGRRNEGVSFRSFENLDEATQRAWLSKARAYKNRGS